MHIFQKTTVLVAFSALLGACAHYGTQAMGPAKAVDGVLAGSNGMTLYTFDRDVTGSGKSVCNGPCATNWPPLLVKERESAGSDYSVVTRDDGTHQWAYKGKPLYFWAKDQKPGDKTGDGFNNIWHVAKP
jgi:predicted lipoprotein with Yx(FWY)xxD motif